jgi:hypothetical protein
VREVGPTDTRMARSHTLIEGWVMAPPPKIKVPFFLFRPAFFPFFFWCFLGNGIIVIFYRLCQKIDEIYTTLNIRWNYRFNSREKLQELQDKNRNSWGDSVIFLFCFISLCFEKLFSILHLNTSVFFFQKHISNIVVQTSFHMWTPTKHYPVFEHWKHL